jgi:hypothetical protein
MSGIICGKWCKDTGVIGEFGEETRNVLYKTKEGVDIGCVLWYQPVQDLVDFGGVCLDTSCGDMMPEKIKF